MAMPANIAINAVSEQTFVRVLTHLVGWRAHLLRQATLLVVSHRMKFKETALCACLYVYERV